MESPVSKVLFVAVVSVFIISTLGCSTEGPDEPDLVFEETLLIGEWEQLSNHYYYCDSATIAIHEEEASGYWMTFTKDNTWKTGNKGLSVIYNSGTWEYLGYGVFMLEASSGYFLSIAPVFPDRNTMHFNYDTPCYDYQDKHVFKMEVAVRR